MSTQRNNPIAKAIRFALIGGAAAAVASPVFAADEAAEEEQRIEVTGSRIKRTDIEGATPVIVLDAETMQRQGRISVAEALRSGTFNNFGSTAEASGGTGQAQATVDLLGIGSERTLVLMDGRRMPGSPSLGGTAVNLNTIPLAMVERIEILKDGGSAVYGSDAVAGVINIITRKDYEGVTLEMGATRHEEEGADDDHFSLVLGASGEKGNVTMALEKYQQKPIADKDRPYTAPRYSDLNGDGVISIYDETEGVSYFGATVVNPDDGTLQASPLCDELTATVPGFVGVLDAGSVLGGIGSGTVCGYAYGNVAMNKAGLDRTSVFVNGNYEINSNVEAFARAIWARNESFGRYAAAAAGYPAIPADSPHNPFGEEAYGYWRWYGLGNRDDTGYDYSMDTIAGVRGSFGDSAEWEVYYHHNLADQKQIGDTYLSITGLYTAYFLGIDFGSPEGLGALGATTIAENTLRFDHWFAGVSFDAGEIGGSPISHYVGAEAFDIKFDSDVDHQSENGWVGGSAGNASGGSRDVKAMFYEAVLPLTDTLEINVAARFDDYSDFGSATSPKASLSWRPTDGLLVRASYGKGFRAPTLSDLFAADAFSAEFVTDYVACQAAGTPLEECPESQANTTVQANREIEEEKSTFINMGVVWNPTDALTLRGELYNVEVEDVVAYVSVQSLVYMELLGQEFPDSNRRLEIIRNPATGRISEAFTTSENGSVLDVTGVDFEVDFKLDLGGGRLGLAWQNSYLIDYETDVFFTGPVQETIGFPGQPQFRSQLTATYDIGDFSATWNMDYIDEVAEAVSPVVTANSVSLKEAGTLDALTLHNIAFSYDSGSFGKYTVGVRNVTDEDPPLSSIGAFGNLGLYYNAHLGRAPYANVSFSF